MAHIQEAVICWSLAGMGVLCILFGTLDTIRGKVAEGWLMGVLGLLLGGLPLLFVIILAATWHNLPRP